MSGNSLSHASVSEDAGSVNSSITTESARVEELERLLTQDRNEINLSNNQITVSSSVTRHGNDTFSAMVRKRKKTKQEKAQVGELRNVLKGIMNKQAKGEVPVDGKPVYSGNKLTGSFYYGQNEPTLE